ncbi:MAG TPA: NAD-dependent epimerase/dehydratase family protein, partial [Candidatus Eremiobacteraeota bacterium]|nr:NAD-dependent epimerase/dehydratase family protein [Candidatus Eremiobacteraeota bacterium]
MNNILVTGIAGFIGFHITRRLIKEAYEVTGMDNINNYYDRELKYGRLKELGINKEFIDYNKLLFYKNLKFLKLNLEDRENIELLFKREKFDFVINLAAQPGVRYSIENPYIYVDSNIKGFLNILEGCRHNSVKHLLFASSSSIYGLNEIKPFSIHNNVDHPISLYAATKKANELMAHTYSHLYNIPVTGLRFFTVYGPWGRPDMAYFKFTEAIFKEKTIDIYNKGKMKRDFTFIDDIVEGIIRLIKKIPRRNKNWNGLTPDPGTSPAPFKLYNIGNNNPVELMYFISLLEHEIGKTAKKNFLP